MLRNAFLICMKFGASCVSKHKLHTGAASFWGDESRNLPNSTQISKEGLAKTQVSEVWTFTNVTSITDDRLLSRHEQQGVIRVLRPPLESPAAV